MKYKLNISQYWENKGEYDKNGRVRLKFKQKILSDDPKALLIT
jgi:hypothetical protein